MMNVILAVGLLTGLFMVKFEKLADADQSAVVAHVMHDSAAAKAGIRDGDRIVRFDGKLNPTWEDISLKEISSAGRSLDVDVERSGKIIHAAVTPVFDDHTGVGVAGWAPPAQVEVGDLTPGMPAQKAGLKKGDILLSVNGQPVQSIYTFKELIEGSQGKPVAVEFERDGKRQAVTAAPVYGKFDSGQARWVVGLNVGLHLNIITTRLSFPAALRESIQQNVKGASLIFKFLGGIIERRMSPKSLQGPIRIAQLSGEAAREGPSAFFLLMSMVSLNLAIFNLLPIPILDGGGIMLLLVEMLIRRDLSLQVKEAVFKVGFVFLIMVMVFVIYNDISKILPTG
jgi:regulator of sigma E protease